MKKVVVIFLLCQFLSCTLYEKPAKLRKEEKCTIIQLDGIWAHRYKKNLSKYANRPDSVDLYESISIKKYYMQDTVFLGGNEIVPSTLCWVCDSHTGVCRKFNDMQKQAKSSSCIDLSGGYVKAPWYYSTHQYYDKNHIGEDIVIAYNFKSKGLYVKAICEGFTRHYEDLKPPFVVPVSCDTTYRLTSKQIEQLNLVPIELDSFYTGYRPWGW